MPMDLNAPSPVQTNNKLRNILNELNELQRSVSLMDPNDIMAMVTFKRMEKTLEKKVAILLAQESRVEMPKVSKPCATCHSGSPMLKIRKQPRRCIEHQKVAYACNEPSYNYQLKKTVLLKTRRMKREHFGSMTKDFILERLMRPTPIPVKDAEQFIFHYASASKVSKSLRISLLEQIVLQM